MDGHGFAGMSGWSPEPPTNPSGSGSPPPRPTGRPPSGPPPAQPPTQRPGGGQGGWPLPPAQPPSGPPGPPYGGPPGPPGPPYGQPPPRRRKRWPLFLALGLVLVLVAGLGVFGWAYFTGRFAFGPLSEADKAAGDAIAEDVGAPAWADEDDVDCAVDELVEEERSEGLEERGLVEKDGDDWTYVDEWETEDATAYVEMLFDCSDGWAERVGDEWGLEDTDCLEDIDSDTLAAYFAADTVTFADEDDAEEARDQGVEALDECYASEPPAPTADAEPAYRAVRFTFAEPEVETGEVSLNIDQEGSWEPLRRSTVKVDTEQGGGRACVSAQTVATYPWGTTATAEDEFCGESEPRRIWWAKAPCNSAPGCYGFALKYEGFKSFDSITAVYSSDGGDCLATSGSCTDTVLAEADGRGTIVTWTFPASYDGRFTAKVGKFEEAIPN